MTAAPIRMAHRGAGTRYASTNRPTMRNVSARVTVALIFLALIVATLIGADGGSAIADQCSDVLTGTDSAPADVVDICMSVAK